MSGLAVTAGARIPHQNADPFGADVILLFGRGDFTDYSPLHQGTDPAPSGQTVDPTDPVGGIASILCTGAVGEIAQIPSTLQQIAPPFIAEIWFKAPLPGNLNSHPILSSRDSSHHGLFFFVSGNVTPNCQWIFTNAGGAQVNMAPQAFVADTWMYTALLVDANHSCAHIGQPGGMTTPGTINTPAGAFAVNGVHWAFGQDTTDSGVINLTYAGRYAQIRVTQNTTRGLVVDDGHGNGVPFTVPTPPFPIP